MKRAYKGGRPLRAVIVGMVFWCGVATASADDTVRFDPASGRFDRNIPSSAQFVFDLPAPGKEAVKGQLELWPSQSDCSPPTSDKQHYTLAMFATGSDQDRVLRATVPPLQVNTRFCIKVRVTKGLDETSAVGFAARIVAELRRPTVGANHDQGCSDVAAYRTALATKIGAAIRIVTAARVQATRAQITALSASPDPKKDRTETESAEPLLTPTMEQEAARAIGTAVVDGVDLEALCNTLNNANSDSANAAQLAAMAAKAFVQAMDKVRPHFDDSTSKAVPAPILTSRVRSRLPAFVSINGQTIDVRRFEDVVEQDQLLAAAALDLDYIDPALAGMLRAISVAKDDAKPALRGAFKRAIAARALKELSVSYVASGQRIRADLSDLFDVAQNGDTVEAWRERVAERRAAIAANLDLLKRQLAAFAVSNDANSPDATNARTWFLALDNASAADAVYTATKNTIKSKLDAVDTARAAIDTKLKERLASADVRALVSSVSSVTTTQSPTASQTDEGASSVSADVGVLLALPFHKDYARTGWEPWLVPYAGVNIYAERVDRVVPFKQLVGSWAAQRLSFTVGALLTRPKINGEQISFTFRDSGLIPIAAIGLRLTSFTRASLGGFAFDYEDDNPASAKKHHGGAIWFGVSIDADVWAAVQGKAFK